MALLCSQYKAVFIPKRDDLHMGTARFDNTNKQWHTVPHHDDFPTKVNSIECTCAYIWSIVHHKIMIHTQYIYIYIIIYIYIYIIRYVLSILVRMIPIAYSDSLGFRYTLAESRRADSRESLVLVPGPGKSRWWKLLLDWYPLVNVHITDGKIHHFLWENSVFLWPFSIAMLNYQRVSSSCIHIFVDWLVVTGTWLDDFSHHIGNS